MPQALSGILRPCGEGSHTASAVPGKVVHMREHNGRRTSQYFYDTCKFNPGFPDSLFTKDSLKKGASEELTRKNKN